MSTGGSTGGSTLVRECGIEGAFHPRCVNMWAGRLMLHAPVGRGRRWHVQHRQEVRARCERLAAKKPVASDVPRLPACHFEVVGRGSALRRVQAVTRLGVPRALHAELYDHEKQMESDHTVQPRSGVHTRHA